MLSNLRTSKLAKAGITGIVALGVTLSTLAPAQALGRNEKNFLKGVAATIVAQQVIKSINTNRQARIAQGTGYAPSYSFVQPAPVYASTRPAYQPRPTYRPTQAAYVSPIYSSPVATAFNAYSNTDRKRIQQRLAAQGYYTSGIDGAFGQGTYNAINAYANAQGKATQLNTPAGVHGVFGDMIY